jgi:tRNA dimethylallyltransferase
MIHLGLVAEVEKVKEFRHTNALNTVGYKEIFNYIDGTWDLPTAIDKIKQNSRIYSRKQMTWFKKDETIHWFHPDDIDAILSFVKNKL